jgi:hypothetical protein
MLFAKSEIKAVLKRTASDPIERHLAKLLGKKRLLSDELKMIITELCQRDSRYGDELKNLKRMTKTCMLN